MLQYHGVQLQGEIQDELDADGCLGEPFLAISLLYALRSLNDDGVPQHAQLGRGVQLRGEIQALHGEVRA